MISDGICNMISGVKNRNKTKTKKQSRLQNK